MHSFLRGLLVAGGIVLAGATTTAFAEGLENGDFAKGKSKWMGDGLAMFLKPDGTLSPTDDSKSSSLLPPPGSTPAEKPKNIPVIEIKLKTTQFADFFQKFKTAKEMDAMNAEITYKASADFALNDKATVFDREITWGSGSFYYWSALVHPKIDLLMRLDKKDNYMYKLQTVKPGGDWQKMKVAWKDVGGGQEVNFHILAAPGHGSLLVKSVTITP
ncbi:MAG: hypothetical protein ABJF10_17835 [Chthoniobacter sp.]|uniref:hypothetical protein n=1 Tax=Chthoniobacter sp. TaxID=2510640 RepID=UPI0032A984DF